MKIELNKFYRTRNGHKARIYTTDGYGDYPIHGAVLMDNGWRLAMWSSGGNSYANGARQDTFDLISAWTDTSSVNWAAMPAWCNYVAMDENGHWYAHEIEPTINYTWWESDGLSVFIPKEYHPIFTANWKDSLAKRP